MSAVHYTRCRREDLHSARLKGKSLWRLGDDLTVGINLLFPDVRMPCMGGLRLAAAAHTLRPDLKVVFTSGYVDSTSLPDDAAFVPKPWGVDDIANAIHIAQKS